MMMIMMTKMMVLVKMMMLIVMGAGHHDTSQDDAGDYDGCHDNTTLVSSSFCSSRMRFLAESIVVLVYNENRSPIPSQAGLRRLHTPEPRNETAAHIRIALILEVANVIGQPA